MKRKAAIRCPTHPGEILREDILPALGLSVTALADDLGVSRQAVHALLAKRAGVSPEMAGRWVPGSHAPAPSPGEGAKGPKRGPV